MSLIPFGVVTVSGASMVPAYRDGDRLIVRHGALVRPGDVVIARDPRVPARILVKRVRDGNPEEGWWLLADNPYAQGDSREFGRVPQALIIARVVCRFRPVIRRR